jgi:protein gp37
MAANSKIEWTMHTFNPWRGCTKVSPGCANCYAEALSHRNPKVLGVWGDNGTRVVAAESAWREPLKWDRAAAAAGERHRVFCASLADVFEDRPELVKPRRRLWQLICATPHLDWLLLTKRPENINRMLGPRGLNFYAVEGPVPCPQPNVWFGVSVEDQARADERIPLLLQTPAAVRFLSCEPLLGPVEFSDVTKRSDAVAQLGKKALGGIDWVIVGGESGHGARPMHPAWARSLRDQCQAAGVAFFFKQWGEYAPCPSADWHGLGPVGKPKQYAMSPSGELCGGFLGKDFADQREAEGWRAVQLLGKHAAGRLLDGREWNELPEGVASVKGAIQ